MKMQINHFKNKNSKILMIINGTFFKKSIGLLDNCSITLFYLILEIQLFN